jgi:hypothetical protein
MTYMGKPYYPAWLDNLADDVTFEAAAMDGVARGAETVRLILVTAREQYEHQSSSSRARLATTDSWRTTQVASAASTPPLSSWLPSTQAGRPSESW